MSDYFYVYMIFYPDSLIPMYVGKGQRRRMYQSCRALSGGTVIKVAHNLSQYAALLLEAELIKSYGRKNLGTGPLLNKTDGGGSAGWSKAARAAWLATVKGRKRDLAFCAAVSARMKGNVMTTQQRAAISRTLTGHKQSAEQIEKRAAKNRGQKRSAEFCAALSSRKKGIPVTPRGTKCPGRNVGRVYSAATIEKMRRSAVERERRKREARTK